MSASTDIPAVLLVGGLGTRLRSVVQSTPKALAAVGGRSFLELLVRQLRHQGIRRLVMCTGFLADQIESEFGNGGEWDVAIDYSRELAPMGTAGAIKLAGQHLRGAETFVAMNGDSFLEVDFDQLIRFHHAHGGLASMAVLQVKDAGRYGAVRVDTESRVIGFREKSATDSAGLVNAGIYVFNRAIFDHLPDGPASLEKDVFPNIVDLGIFALEQRGMFIDIGIPEDYARAQQIYDQLCAAALRT